MSASDKVKALLTLRGKKQAELANYFGMTKQTMSNKVSRDSWSAADLARVAEFTGCRIGFVLPDGQHIFLDPPEDKKSPDT